MNIDPQTLSGAGLALGTLAAGKLVLVAYAYLFKQRVPIERLKHAEAHAKRLENSQWQETTWRRRVEKERDAEKAKVATLHKQLAALGKTYNQLRKDYEGALKYQIDLEKQNSELASRNLDIRNRLVQAEVDLQVARGYTQNAPQEVERKQPLTVAQVKPRTKKKR